MKTFFEKAQRSQIALSGRRTQIPFEVLTRAVEQADDSDAKVTRVRVAISSDLLIERTDCFGLYYEKLSHSANAVDLTWANSGNAPMHFYAHMATQTHGAEGHCGNIANAEIVVREDGVRQVECDLVFYKGDKTDELALQRIRSGKLRNVSVGYSVTSPDDVRETYDHRGELIVEFLRWRVDEVTLCSLPVDKQGSGMGRQVGADASFYKLTERSTQPQGNNQVTQKTDEAPPKERTPESQVDMAAVQERAAQILAERASQTKPAHQREDKPSGERTEDVSKSVVPFLTKLRAEGISQEAENDFTERAFNARTVGEVRSIFGEVMEAQMKTDKKTVRAPAVHTKKHTYDVGRTVAAVIARRVPDGLEGEMHQESVKNGTRANGGVAVPLAGPNGLFRSANALSKLNGMRRQQAKTLGRTVNVGSNTNAGALTNDFIEADLIEALVPMGTLLELCSAWPQMLNQDLKIPVEIGYNVPNWVNETSAASDATAATTGTVGDSNTHPEYSTTTKSWTWHALRHTIHFTDRMADQTTIIEDRLVETLGNDMPRMLDRTICVGSGSGAEPQGLIPKLLAATGNLAPTAFGPNGFGTAANQKGGAPTWTRVNQLLVAMRRRNVINKGDPIYLTTPEIAGRMMEMVTVERTGAVGGQMILDGKTMMAANGVPVIVNNHLQGNLNANKQTGTTATHNLHPLLCIIPSLIKLGYFGDITLLIDPYSKKATGTDIQVRWPVTFENLYDEHISGAVDVANGLSDPS